VSEHAGGAGPPAAEGPAASHLLDRGETAERTGHLGDAEAAYRAAAAAGDPALAAEALFRLGRVAWRHGRYDEAIADYARARDAAHRIGATGLRARIENGVGAVHYSRGEYRQARACYAVAHDLAQDDSLRGKILLNLGVLANIAGDFDDARVQYTRSRAAFEKARDDDGQALVLHNLGMLHADHAEWDEAADAYARCLTLSERRDNRQMIANVLVNRAEVFCARDDAASAVASCNRAITIFREIGDEPGHGEALRWLGMARHRAGDLDGAEHALREAVRVAARLRIGLLEAEAARAMGAVATDRGDTTSAVKWLRRSLTRFGALGARRDAADVAAQLEALGGADQAAGAVGNDGDDDLP
jgi:tetratricopeptide (TPR) repeat protein